MTRKDFILIASIIRDGLEGINTAEDVAKAFAKGLKVSNPNFKADLFYQAAIGKVDLNARRAR